MRILAALILLVGVLLPSYSDIEVRTVAVTSIPFIEVPEPSDVFKAIRTRQSDMFYGVGWEVIRSHIGIGGNYLVDFYRDENRRWSIDWLGEALFVSYHLFGAGSFIDLFAQAGVGCAGSVYLGNDYVARRTDYGTMESDYQVTLQALTIGIFPFASTGIAFNLSGFIIGTRLAYVPAITPPPVTDFDAYPLKNFQVSIFIGASFGGRNDCCDWDWD